MKRRYIVILAIILVIGFASVTTTLVLNGKVGVGVELDDFDVIFTSALLNAETSNKVIISENKKTITFNTDKLINKGDTARLDYKVKNTSTQYNADVEINCTNEANEYISVISEFDGNQIPLVSPVNIKAGEVKSGYINAELIKTYAGEDTSMEIKCSIVVTATSRETYAYSLAFNSNGGSSIEDKSVILNNEYGELEIPVKVGYNFLGWYDEEDNKVDESTILDSKGNRTLYAKWEEKVYDLNIVTKKDGNDTTKKLDITYGEKVTIKINEKNYYISSMDCSEGYTIEDYELVIPTYGEQIINIRNNKVDKEGTCTFTLEQGIYEYGYTGGEQSFVAPLNGEYKIEIWGAQGGDLNSSVRSEFYSMLKNVTGGYGGYSTGNIILDQNSKIFINVGGQGQPATYTNTNPKGGYNGGGAGGVGYAYYWIYTCLRSAALSSAGGGGATHVATESGLLKSFKSKKDKVVIVAGGGAGSPLVSVAAGNGGGISGTIGRTNSGITTNGATQTSGYDFGIGQNGHNSIQASTGDAEGSSGGGGGWYGGLSYQGIETNSDASGSGGSGYIGSTLLTDKVMYCYNCTSSSVESTKTVSTTCTSSTPTSNCAKQGNGYAKITLVSIN